MKTPFETRVLTSAEELNAIAEEWTELFKFCRDATPFQRPEWLQPWIEIFCPEKIRAIEVRREGGLVGLAPLLIYPRGEERVLAFSGGGVSDYLNILVAPPNEDEIISAMFQQIRNLADWTVLDLTDLPAYSVLRRTELVHSATPHDTCSTLFLPSTKNELVHLFSKHQRANLRNARSRLERIGGGEVEVATDKTLPEFLDDLFRLHTSRWSQSGEPGVLADPEIKTFHRRAAPKLLAKGILRLSRLRTRDGTIAVLYTLLGQSTLFCYMQGYDPEFAFLSPGTLLMYSAIENAVDSGMGKFDFLRGDEAYKRHWLAQNENTFRIQFSGSNYIYVGGLQDVAA
ncbi:MAG TPA: GNAT family N-acetyltransferase [Terriglobales bacterium]|jgi:CelD/BcsL family acetyltransferase involved in cellulose biosynthesis